MNQYIKIAVAFTLLITFIAGYAQKQSTDIEQIISGEHRSEKNITRNEFRHPQQTLAFFGVKPDMTVVELWPGGGWYTEILAPYLAADGQLIAAHRSEEHTSELQSR